MILSDDEDQLKISPKTRRYLGSLHFVADLVIEILVRQNVVQETDAEFEREASLLRAVYDSVEAHTPKPKWIARWYRHHLSLRTQHKITLENLTVTSDVESESD